MSCSSHLTMSSGDPGVVSARLTDRKEDGLPVAHLQLNGSLFLSTRPPLIVLWKFLIYSDCLQYPGQTRTTLGQLCTALWDSQSQPGFEPG